MAIVKHMALNLIKSAPGKDSLQVKRKAAGWDDDFLLAILRDKLDELQAIALGRQNLCDYSAASM